MLNGQDVPVSLNRELAPCGVNSFLSLASQGFYDNTDCSRLTVSEQLNILQCGDPTGQGNGGVFEFNLDAVDDRRCCISRARSICSAVHVERF